MKENYGLNGFYGIRFVNLAAKAAHFTDIRIVRNKVAKFVIPK